MGLLLRGEGKGGEGEEWKGSEGLRGEVICRDEAAERLVLDVFKVLSSWESFTTADEHISKNGIWLVPSSRKGRS